MQSTNEILLKFLRKIDFPDLLACDEVLGTVHYGDSSISLLPEQGLYVDLNLSINSLTHYLTTNFRLFQTEKFADDNFKFDENGRKLSKQVENTVGEGEIACYEQFLLFPQCFQKACFPGASKGVIVWEWVN